MEAQIFTGVILKQDTHSRTVEVNFNWGCGSNGKKKQIYFVHNNSNPKCIHTSTKKLKQMRRKPAHEPPNKD